MGEPYDHIPVKLIAGFISSSTQHITLVRKILERRYGEIDAESPVLDFCSTDYYEQEFGRELKRVFISFKRLITLKQNYRIKVVTNAIERKYSRHNARIVNIDPGYVTLSKLVLFTTKNRSHRIYLDKGI